MSRSTLADANDSHDWRIFADFAQVPIHLARPLYVADPIGVELDQGLYALDSTTIDLCLPLFPWAMFRENKGAVKMHTLLDLHGNIPTFISITSGKVHDVNILDEILPEAGAFYVMDRGYVDFERLYVFTLSSAFLRVVSARNRQHSRSSAATHTRVDKATGVRSDHTVILTAIGSANVYPDPLRRVSYLDVQTRKRFKFLTNNFTLPALTVALIYKGPLAGELFFKSDPGQHLPESEILLWHQRKKRRGDLKSGSLSRSTCWSPSSGSAVGARRSAFTRFYRFSASRFSRKTPILQALQPPDSQQDLLSSANQLILFD